MSGTVTVVNQSAKDQNTSKELILWDHLEAKNTNMDAISPRVVHSAKKIPGEMDMSLVAAFNPQGLLVDSKPQHSVLLHMSK
eukprot:5169234-Amphidinium_carterae.1